MNALLEGLVDLLPEPGTVDAKGLQRWLDTFSAALELVYGGTVLPPVAIGATAASPPAEEAPPSPPGARRGHEVGATQAGREIDAAISLVRSWMAKYPARAEAVEPASAPLRRLVDQAPTTRQLSEPPQFPAAGPIERRPVDHEAARAGAMASL